MLPNGNLETVASPIQHKCVSKDHLWSCVEYGWDIGNLLLKMVDGDPYEDGYSCEIQVNFCPFCGYRKRDRG
jgi:hypothetical protein